MSRGLTLIEMLLALALMSALIVSASTWVSIASASGAAGLRRHQTHLAVEAVFRLIHDDLACGDFERTQPNMQHPVRWRCLDGSFEIATRESGAGRVIHRYLYDKSSSTLSLEIIRTAPEINPTIQRPLLDDVRSFSVAIQDPHVEVRIEMVNGEAYRRRINLP